MTVPWSLVQTVAPTEEPIALEDAKAHLNIDADDKDATLVRMISGVRAYVEQYLNRGLLTQTWKMTLDAFVDELDLPMAAPLRSVTSVKYYDTAGVLQTLATTYYHVDTVSQPGRIVLAPTQIWPTVQAQRTRPVEITYVVGWDLASIPGDILDAMYLLIGDREQFLSDTVMGYGTIAIMLPRGVNALLASHRVHARPPAGCW